MQHVARNMSARIRPRIMHRKHTIYTPWMGALWLEHKSQLRPLFVKYADVHHAQLHEASRTARTAISSTAVTLVSWVECHANGDGHLIVASGSEASHTPVRIVNANLHGPSLSHAPEPTLRRKHASVHRLRVGEHKHRASKARRACVRECVRA